MLFPLFDLNPHQRWPVVTLLTIALNFGAMVWTSSLSEKEQGVAAMEYGFIPARLSDAGQGKKLAVPIPAVDRKGNRVRAGEVVLSTKTPDVYRTFLTAMFMHAGWLHLVMNMWPLWIFGNNIEDRLGHFVYIFYYLLGGVVATLAFWASDTMGLTPMVGASGAVAAVLGGYAVTFPMVKVRTLVFFLLIAFIDIPAVVVLGFWFVMQLVSGVMGFWGVLLDPVAYWAHIGGFIAGMILMPLFTVGASPPGKDWRKEAREMFDFKDPRFDSVE